MAVNSKVLALDDSGSSHFMCTFSIAPHILKIIQKDEDKFDLSIDNVFVGFFFLFYFIFVSNTEMPLNTYSREKHMRNSVKNWMYIFN